MASIRKVNNKWLAEIRTKGVYKSKTFFSKIEAQSWAIGIERNLGKHSHIASSYTLMDAIEKYQAEVSPTKKGARWEILRLNKLKRHKLADCKLSSITREDIQSWVDEQNKVLSPGSVRRELVLISSLLKVARVKWKWFEGEPIKDIDWPKAPQPRDRRISLDEIEKVLEALGYHEDKLINTINDELAVAFLFALETAMRQGEIWKLGWENIFLEKSYVRLTETKNGTSRNVPLSTRAKELLRKLEPAEKGKAFRSSQSSANTLFRRALKKTDIINLTFHDTRHEALTRLARKIDVLDLARMVGHRDPRSLMIYYNATATEIAGRLG